MASAPVPVTDAGINATVAAAKQPAGVAALAHLARLREDPTSVNPPDWRVDWADGPWPVKVYTGGRRIPLGSGGHAEAGQVDLAGLGRVLFGTFGVSRVRFDPRGGLPPTPDTPRPARQPRLSIRRPIPSGGAMYPTEAYLLIPATMASYHYDPYRHELTDLGVPGPPGQSRLPAVFGRAGDAQPAAVLVLANRFWKNYYKYGEFAFRLGTVDTGVALGRAVRLARTEFGRVDVRTGFADADCNAWFGLDGQQETSYAVVLIGVDGGRAGRGTPPDSRDAGGAGWRPQVVERSGRIKRSARFAALQAAASVPGAGLPRTSGASGPDGPGGPGGGATKLPAAAPIDQLDLDTMLRRTSNGPLFTGDPVPAEVMATVLWHTARSLAELRRAACDRFSGAVDDVGIHCAVHRVDGVPAGWYRYRRGSHDLVAVGAGRRSGSGRELQEALLADSVNVELAAFTVHLTGRTGYRRDGGVRGYREQQLAVGAAIEASTLLAAAAGLGSHPLLGFDANRVDRAYGLASTGRGVHAQVCAGPVRPDLNWEITVVPR